MGNRQFAVLVFAVVALSVCVAPISCEESDAATTVTERYSDRYVYETETMASTVANVYYSYAMYFMKDSANHQQMLRYLADPLNESVSADDTEEVRERVWSGWDGEIVVYYTSTQPGQNVLDFFGGTVTLNARTVLEPYGDTVILNAKGGDTVTVTLNSMSCDRGEEGAVYIRDLQTYESVELVLGQTLSIEVSNVHAFEVYPNTYGSLYMDYSMTYDGVTEPNGSPMMFAAICFVIAALVIAVVAFAAMKPKWSK